VTISKTVFLTGFPGFIAGRLLERLAREDVQFFLLVQQEFVERAIGEIEAIAGRTGTPLENFAVIPGDVTLRDLGIGAEDLETIRDETTDIFHLAAVYDLAVEKDTAFKVNLEGTRNVNDFARSVKNLNRYNYVSTCYVAGKRQGRIREDELEHKAGFRNFYEETKYLAEMEVERLKEELPVTIYRPSVVVGDSQTGETAKYDGIYYLIQYLRKAPGVLRFINVGNKTVKLNLVPVDFVVNGIAALSDEPAAIGKTIALADPNPLSTAQLFDAITKAMTGKGSAYTPPPKVVEWSLLQSLSPRITGLPHYAVPYFFISQTYDTSLANELLPKHGIACPSFSSYVGKMVKFVEAHPKL
jgi:thioester reductase-like protein